MMRNEAEVAEVGFMQVCVRIMHIVLYYSHLNKGLSVVVDKKGKKW